MSVKSSYGAQRPTNMNSIIKAWNKTANVWLREGIYTRMPRKLATPAVFLCSAIWHGFYPGYYLFFVTAGFFLAVSRLVRKRVRPYFLVNLGDGVSSRVYDAITVSVTTFCLNYMALPFVLLEFNKSFQFWRQFYFCGHVGIVVLIVVVWLLPRPGCTISTVTSSTDSSSMNPTAPPPVPELQPHEQRQTASI